MTEPVAYKNGRFLLQSQVSIALNDTGFVWGATVTDLCRTFRHKLFRLEDHIRRFQQSCRLARVPQSLSDVELTDIAVDVTGRNAKLLAPQQELVLVFVATPGVTNHNVPRRDPEVSEWKGPTLIVHTYPLPYERYSGLFREGARLITSTVRHLPPESVPPQIKHRSRLFWWLAEREVENPELRPRALVLDSDGHITETAAANFLLVRNGKVLSPRREHILGGISLQMVEELCRELGIGFREQDLTLDDCATADEAMLTCTTFCLSPVSRINSHSLAWPGPVFERLLAAWSAKVGVDIRGQMLRGIMELQ